MFRVREAGFPVTAHEPHISAICSSVMFNPSCFSAFASAIHSLRQVPNFMRSENSACISRDA